MEKVNSLFIFAHFACIQEWGERAFHQDIDSWLHDLHLGTFTSKSNTALHIGFQVILDPVPTIEWVLRHYQYQWIEIWGEGQDTMHRKYLPIQNATRLDGKERKKDKIICCQKLWKRWICFTRAHRRYGKEGAKDELLRFYKQLTFRKQAFLYFSQHLHNSRLSSNTAFHNGQNGKNKAICKGNRVKELFSVVFLLML